jgi:hypothetical protein
VFLDFTEQFLAIKFMVFWVSIRRQAELLLVSFLGLLLGPEDGGIIFSEMSALLRNTQPYDPEDLTLHDHRREKSNPIQFLTNSYRHIARKQSSINGETKSSVYKL